MHPHQIWTIDPVWDERWGRRGAIWKIEEADDRQGKAKGGPLVRSAIVAAWRASFLQPDADAEAHNARAQVRAEHSEGCRAGVTLQRDLRVAVDTLKRSAMNRNVSRFPELGVLGPNADPGSNRCCSGSRVVRRECQARDPPIGHALVQGELYIVVGSEKTILPVGIRHNVCPWPLPARATVMLGRKPCPELRRNCSSKSIASEKAGQKKAGSLLGDPANFPAAGRPSGRTFGAPPGALREAASRTPRACRCGRSAG